MATKSQETASVPELTPKDQERILLEEIQQLKTPYAIREWEATNKDRVCSSPSWRVKGAFDDLWKLLCDEPYFMSVTTAPKAIIPGQMGETGPNDPASVKYREKVRFRAIQWQKTRRKFARKFHDLFTLQGTEYESGDRRPIYQNLRKHRLYHILPSDLAGKIEDAALKGKKESGEINGIDVEIYVEGFWEVMFHPRRGGNDTADARVYTEGLCLRMARMQPVIMPGFYLENIDHGLRAQYEQNSTPGANQQGRKLVGWVQEYTYTVRRKATRREYLAMKASGDKIQEVEQEKAGGMQ